MRINANRVRSGDFWFEKKFMKISSTIIGYITGLLAAFFWGIHPVIIRFLTLEGVSPFLIAGLRLYIGCLALALILSAHRLWNRKHVQRETKKMDYNIYFWIAGISLGINFLIFQLGLRYTLASDATLIENFAPVMVLLIMSLFFVHRFKEIAPTEHFGTRVFQIVLLGSIGASLVLINDVNDKIIPGQTKMLGDLIIFIGMIFFAIFLISGSEFLRTQKLVTNLRATTLILAVAAIPVTFFMPFGELSRLSVTQWLLLGFIGVFSTGFAYWMWNISSRHLHVVPLSLNIIYTGIITVLAEALFLQLALDWKFIIGGSMMIFASIAAESLSNKAKNYLKHTEERYGNG